MANVRVTPLTEQIRKCKAANKKARRKAKVEEPQTPEPAAPETPETPQTPGTPGTPEPGTGGDK